MGATSSPYGYLAFVNFMSVFPGVVTRRRVRGGGRQYCVLLYSTERRSSWSLN